ncbi:MAG: sugar kinase [Roseibium sp.]|nr:sugar kinase [Roseibium sp.]
MTRVLCIGSAVLDFTFTFDQLPDRAEKYVAQSADIVGGGIAANAAVAIVRLGGNAVLGARLGDDPVGETILAGLRAENVDVSRVTRTPGARSSYSSVYINSEGERQITNFRGEGLRLDVDAFEDVEDLDAVLVDTRLPDAALFGLQLAQRRGIPGVLDGEAPVDPRLIDAASHVAFSRPGLEATMPDRDPDDALRETAERHGVWTCMTNGALGTRYTHEGSILHFPAFDVNATDTLGAGDVWHGAFALALGEGMTATDAVRFASAAAALKCTRPGGRAGTPDRATVTQFLKEKQQ